MDGDRGSTKLDPAGDPLDAIEDLVDHLAGLARSDVRVDDFYRELLQGAVRAMAAVAGAVWMIDGDGRLQLGYQLNLARTQIDESPESTSQHLRLIERAISAEGASLFPPGDEPSPGQEPRNVTGQLLVVGPLVLDGEPLGLIEIFQRRDTPADAQRGYLHFLATLAELAVDFERNRRLRQLRAAESLWGEFAQFARRVHGSLDLGSHGLRHCQRRTSVDRLRPCEPDYSPRQAAQTARGQRRRYV